MADALAWIDIIIPPSTTEQRVRFTFSRDSNKHKIAVTGTRSVRVVRSEVQERIDSGELSTKRTSPDDPAGEAEAGAVDPAGESGREAA